MGERAPAAKLRLPFPSTEHYMLPASEDVPFVCAYDDEPSSIYAYALSCAEVCGLGVYA